MSALDIEQFRDQFVARVDGHLCLLDYEQNVDWITIHHTEVPPDVAGRGIAAALTEAAFNYARASGLLVHPLCSYAVSWLARHPEQLDIVVSGSEIAQAAAEAEQEQEPEQEPGEGEG